MNVRDAIRRDHRKLWGYPSLLLGLWLLSVAVVSSGAWLAQDWRYRDLANRTGDGSGAGGQVNLSTGQMQVVNGQDVRVYMTSDGSADDEATQERHWRDRHPFENSVRSAGVPAPSRNWGASSSTPRPDLRPLQ